MDLSKGETADLFNHFWTKHNSSLKNFDVSKMSIELCKDVGFDVINDNDKLKLNVTNTAAWNDYMLKEKIDFSCKGTQGSIHVTFTDDNIKVGWSYVLCWQGDSGSSDGWMDEW
ncbi:MAG: hypothetical protein EOP66_09080, partial [Sphingomonas sp.]